MAPWLIAALIPQFLWALSTLADKVLLDKYTYERGPLVLTLYSCLFSLVALPVLISVDIGSFVQYHAGMLLLFMSGVLNAVWIWLYLHALNRDDASVVIPFFQVIPLFGVCIAFVFLGERLSTSGILGIVCLVLAAMLLTVEDVSIEAIRKRVATLVLMVVASGVYAVTNVLFKAGASAVSIWSALAWEHVGTLAAGLCILAVSMAHARIFMRSLSSYGARIFSVNIANEGVTMLGNSMFGYALLLGPVALVQSANALHPLLMFLVAVVLTRWAPSFYHEDIASVWKTRLAALLLFAIGLIFLRDYLV